MENKQKNFGKVWKFGKNIDTDIIIAARYLNTSDGKQLAKHIMEDSRGDFYNMISRGDFIVADENFGCGSSREHAPLALKEAGIAAVLSSSFARIFYRNAFNTGLLILELSQNDIDRISEGDELEVDLLSNKITNHTKKEYYNYAKIPPFMLELLNAGGLMPYAQKQLKEQI
ncbi:3-isopropylmalate dehydratase small subunit [Helicobacter cappadocius]|uniref:3-isopropylmalate dehydratase small subunit n=1 Tax=Helicobacter cappadocius TaxID=3063998 RepID=A0AA90T9A8_9HELI|nr:MULTISPECIES: 3-isopropylmalate dehydratase small subunit [unclassified Helicobacter]MDO7253792.1 3-isopropylmalate dehydratase small subunit [Helicobacter sp. faydin-H75]MDP2538672.1 3-isopropylmalate dehydratase small subunit [Helicobacter sp. faydin-H76]